MHIVDYNVVLVFVCLFVCLLLFGVHINGFNRQFPSCFDPRYENEAKYKVLGAVVGCSWSGNVKFRLGTAYYFENL